METKATKDLVDRLNELKKERDYLEIKILKIDIEHNDIVNELCRRMPDLIDDPNLQKVKVKKEINYD